MAVTTREESRAQLMSKPLIDYYLVMIATALLAGFGLIMVLSASSAYAGSKLDQPYVFVIRQTIFLAVGIPVALAVSRLSPKLLAKLGWWGWGAAVLLLSWVAIGSRSIGERGNVNWLSVNSQLAIQPSEFAKLALVVWSASIFASKIRQIDQPRHLILPFVPGAALIMALVLAGHDLGTALVMGLIVMAVLWFIGTPMRLLGSLALLAGGVVAVLVAANANRMARIVVWLNPAADPDRAAQPMSAMFALASGGWWGRGIGSSKQKWGGLMDAPHTDFIFAVLGEELGLIGVLSVLVLFGVIGFIGLRIALRSDHPFTRILAAGLASWFSIQALINILVVLNLLPVLGIPLPFMSYGGSALVANLIGIGMLLACARNEPEARRAIAARHRAPAPKLRGLVASGRAR